jgi:hypothetical protein
MTAKEFIDEVTALVVAHRDREALDLAERMLPAVGQHLSPEQVVQIGDLMEGAQMAVDLDEPTAMAVAPD